MCFFVGLHRAATCVTLLVSGERHGLFVILMRPLVAATAVRGALGRAATADFTAY